MTPISLSTCLENNKTVIGDSCDKLGNKFGNYLVFDQTKGWEVKHLNSLQQILRNCFGFFKETRLSALRNNVEKIAAEEASKIPYLQQKFPLLKVLNDLKGTVLKTEQYVAYAGRGALDVKFGVRTLEDAPKVDQEFIDEAKANKQVYFSKLSPEYKGDPNFKKIDFVTESDSFADVTAKTAEVFKGLGFVGGPFGDQLHILQTAPLHYTITQIAWSAFPKPGLATDIIPIFKSKNLDGNDQYFVLTGTRMLDPGKGKNALLGGFTGIEPQKRKEKGSVENPFMLDSPLFTALKEGKEESGLGIQIPNIQDLREDYEASEVSGKVFCGDKSDPNRLAFDAKIIRIGQFKTGDALMKDGGERLANGEKRVYTTTGYACVVDLGESIINLADKTDAFFKNFKLSAADDIKGLQINDITAAVLDNSEENMKEVEGRLQFGITHHNTVMIKAIETVRNHFNIKA